MTLPKRVEHRQPRVRRDLASALRSAAAGLVVPSGRKRRGAAAEEPDVDPELLTLRDEMRRHPAHRIADREAKVRVAERYLRVERDNEQIRTKVSAATNSLARTFDRIVGLLTERGFIDDRRTATRGSPTTAGCWPGSTARATCWSPSVCARGVWKGLQPAELAAVLSAMVFESRGGDGPAPAHAVDMPTPAVRRALAETRRLSGQLRADEHRHRINPSREPDEGFVAGRLPLGHHRRPGRRAGRLRRRRERLAAVRGRLRAVVPPGARPARPGAQRRPRRRAAHRGETRHRRHPARRRGC